MINLLWAVKIVVKSLLAQAQFACCLIQFLTFGYYLIFFLACINLTAAKTFTFKTEAKKGLVM